MLGLPPTRCSISVAYQYNYAYLHGFASSPNSTKGQHLKRMLAGFGIELALPDLNRPSFARLSPDTVLRELEARCAEAGGAPWRIVGSSLGAWYAALLATRQPHLVDRLVLIAPAFDVKTRWEEMLGPAGLARWLETGSQPFDNADGESVPVAASFFTEASALPQRPAPEVPILILHGTQDEVVPIESSRDYARANSNVELIELDADHALTDHGAHVAAETQRFFELGRATLDRPDL